MTVCIWWPIRRAISRNPIMCKDYVGRFRDAGLLVVRVKDIVVWRLRLSGLVGLGMKLGDLG